MTLSQLGSLALALSCILISLVRAEEPQTQPQTQPQTRPQSQPHSQGHSEGHSHAVGSAEHSFADLERWKGVFDDPARDEWQQPQEVVAALGLESGSVVADLGAGTGYFTIPLARAVAPGGRVLAVDIEPNMVEYLGHRAHEEGVHGVEPILAAPDDPGLPAGSVDRVLVVDTYHHIQDRVDYLRRVMKALSPDGRVAIVDFEKRELPVGPPVEHKLARDEVVEEFRQAGYRLAREETFLPYQYYLVFAPAE